MGKAFTNGVVQLMDWSPHTDNTRLVRNAVFNNNSNNNNNINNNNNNNNNSFNHRLVNTSSVLQVVEGRRHLSLVSGTQTFSGGKGRSGH